MVEDDEDGVVTVLTGCLGVKGINTIGCSLMLSIIMLLLWSIRVLKVIRVPSKVS